MRVAELALRGRELSDLELEGISARSAAPQSHNFSAIAAACAVNMSTLGELPSEASRSVHRAHVSLDCGMRSAPLPPIPSLVETSASTPYTPRTAHRHDVRASVEQLVGLAGEQSRARQTVANRRGSVMGAHRVTQLAGVGKAVMGAHRVTQLAGVPRAAQKSVDLAGVGKAVMGAHRVAGRRATGGPEDCRQRPARLRQPPAGHLAAARPLVLGRADGGGGVVLGGPLLPRHGAPLRVGLPLDGRRDRDQRDVSHHRVPVPEAGALRHRRRRAHRAAGRRPSPRSPC